MESELPWVPGAVRAYLLDDPGFFTATVGKVSTRLPGDVTELLVTVQVVTPMGAMGGGGYKPIVQTDAWCAPAADEDPEVRVWRVASMAARRLALARNVPYESMHWSGRLIDMAPLPPDRSRGGDVPLYRAMARHELTIHNR